MMLRNLSPIHMVTTFMLLSGITVIGGHVMDTRLWIEDAHRKTYYSGDKVLEKDKLYIDCAIDRVHAHEKYKPNFAVNGQEVDTIHQEHTEYTWIYSSFVVPSGVKSISISVKHAGHYHGCEAQFPVKRLYILQSEEVTLYPGQTGSFTCRTSISGKILWKQLYLNGTVRTISNGNTCYYGNQFNVTNEIEDDGGFLSTLQLLHVIAGMNGHRFVCQCEGFSHSQKGILHVKVPQLANFDHPMGIAISSNGKNITENCTAAPGDELHITAWSVPAKPPITLSLDVNGNIMEIASYYEQQRPKNNPKSTNLPYVAMMETERLTFTVRANHPLLSENLTYSIICNPLIRNDKLDEPVAKQNDPGERSKSKNGQSSVTTVSATHILLILVASLCSLVLC